jgi:integrase
LPNPAEHVSVIGAPRTRRALTDAECAALLAYPDGMKMPAAQRREYRLALLLALYTGARLGDVVTLTHDAVNLAAGAIRFTPHKTAHSSGATVAVPLHPALRCALPTIGKGPLLPWLADRYNRNRFAVSRAFIRIFQRAGIEDATFHCLRHTFVSRLAESGAPEAVVRALVGHATSTMTRRYTHVALEASRKAVDALPVVA